jgi:hypothetical protein
MLDAAHSVTAAGNRWQHSNVRRRGADGQYLPLVPMAWADMGKYIAHAICFARIVAGESHVILTGRARAVALHILGSMPLERVFGDWEGKGTNMTWPALQNQIRRLRALLDKLEISLPRPGRVGDSGAVLPEEEIDLAQALTMMDAIEMAWRIRNLSVPDCCRWPVEVFGPAPERDWAAIHCDTLEAFVKSYLPRRRPRSSPVEIFSSNGTYGERQNTNAESHVIGESMAFSRV